MSENYMKLKWAPFTSNDEKKKWKMKNKKKKEE